MKNSGFLFIIFLFLVPLASTAAQPAAPPVSSATSDVLRMASEGVGPDVLLAYVQNSRTRFDLSADDIIALNNAKVGSAVIQAILRRDAPSNPPAAAPAAPRLNPDPGAVPLPIYGSLNPFPGYGPGYWYWNGGWVWVYDSWGWGYRPSPPYRHFGWREVRHR